MQMRRKTKIKRVQKRLRLAAVLIMLGLLIMALDNRIRPIVSTMAQAQCRIISEEAINDAVVEVLSQKSDIYDSLITVTRNADGKITDLTVNSVQENILKAELTSAVMRRLEGLENQPMRVPVGTLLGGHILSGRGPRITMQLIPAAYAESTTAYTFESAGINQTNHQIYFEFSVEMSAILPGYTTQTQIKTRICIAQTVIVGKVPQFYAANT